MKRATWFCFSVILLGIIANIGIAKAQITDRFPTRVITIVVPYPAGGPPDVIARFFGPLLEKELGSPVVIENKPGGGSVIGTSYAARATPDGHTLLAVEPTLVVAPQILAMAGFDPVKDFRPISLTARTFHTLGVATNVPASTVAEFIALANKEPDRIKIAHSGLGTAPFLSALSFVQATGANVLLVPYRGSALAVNDVVGGHISGVFTGPSTTAALARDGKIKILGITGWHRLKSLPDVPTFLESGIEMKGVNDGIWFGLAAPSGTPDAIIDKLNAAIQKAAKDPALIEKLEGQGIFVISTTPEDMRKLIASEALHWKDALLKAGVKPAEQ